MQNGSICIFIHTCSNKKHFSFHHLILVLLAPRFSDIELKWINLFGILDTSAY